MARPDLDLAKNMAVVEPHLAMLAGCMRRAFDTYQNEYPPSVRAVHDNTAAAKNIHRHMLNEVMVATAEVKGMAMVDVRHLYVLNIDDQVVIRFKKLDGEGRSASYPTGQARNFDRQLPLPNLAPAATRLTFGYETDLAFSSIVRVLIACPLGREAHWCVQIHEDASSAEAWTDITPKRLVGTEAFRHYGTEL